MFRANFKIFNLIAPFLSGVSYFFCYAPPIFRANFTKQWTLSNQLQFFPASCVCVFETTESVSRWLHLFRATHNDFAPKLHCFQFNCSYEASLGAVLLTSLNFSPLPTILHRREKPNKLHCKNFDSRLTCSGKLINTELDNNTQLFVVLINASQLFDDSSHCIFLMFANICWWWVPLKVYWGSQSLHFCMQKEKL